jgi:hypothetical protein
LFAANNGYSGNTWDVDPAVTLTEVTAFDVNWDPAGETLDMSFHYTSGSCSGLGSTPGAWTQFATGTGVSVGFDLPTFVDIAGNGQPFNPGVSGMALHCDNWAYLAGYIWYTNGQHSYSNAEIADLTTMDGLAYPAFSYSFFPREVNMTMYYNSGPPPALYITPSTISAYFGGTFTFELFGDGLGGRDYIILGSASGTAPPMVLPGGGLLWLKKDWFTMLLLQATLAGGWGVLDNFLGTLDPDGYATAYLHLPGHCQLYDDIDLWFAWTTYNPFDFQSNTVQVSVTGAPPEIEEYYWDDGTSENALGWGSGGPSVWIHSFDSGPGDDILQVCTTFGSALHASGPAVGTPVDLLVWEDPNQDMNPNDAVWIGYGLGAVANPNTNTFNHFDLDAATPVVGLFFVGAHLIQPVGVYAAPMDENTLGTGASWFAGNYSYGYWHPDYIGYYPYYSMAGIGYDCAWLLRANDP